MNAVNVFSKLGSKAADYSMMPFGSSTNVVNIALYTKGMNRQAYLAGRFVWSKDLSVHTELTKFVLRTTLATARHEHWDVKRCHERIETLVRLALIEHYAPGMFRSATARFGYAGIPESQWYKMWAQRYEVPYQAIERYLDIAYRSVHK